MTVYRVCCFPYITQCYTEPVRRVFKTRTFGRWSRKARISDEVLCAAIGEMVRGLMEPRSLAKAVAENELEEICHEHEEESPAQ